MRTERIMNACESHDYFVSLGFWLNKLQSIKISGWGLITKQLSQNIDNKSKRQLKDLKIILHLRLKMLSNENNVRSALSKHWDNQGYKYNHAKCFKLVQFVRNTQAQQDYQS